MGDLSEHFSRKEFACHCGCGLSAVDPLLVASLESMREILDAPIRVISGLRCKARNEKVGGKPDSQHLYGRAADINVQGARLLDVFRAAESVPLLKASGIGLYPDGRFIHVDTRGTWARWGYLAPRGYCDLDTAWRVEVARESAT